jgi:catechol 2,3-dioxygenase-like lactoylglutathione lyase family enzyme
MNKDSAKSEEIFSTMHVIAVPDLAASAKFYEDTLGFTVHEIGDPGWRIFRRGVFQIMAGHCPDATPPSQTGDHSYFAYVHLRNASSLYRELQQKDVDWIKHIADEPWGMREFGIRTPDGHRIMFGEPLTQN